jgi:hypothetical protein
VSRRLRFAVAFALPFYSWAGSAGAQPARSPNLQKIEDVALALVTEQCPRLLRKQLEIGTDRELKALGLGNVQQISDARLGQIDQVVSERPDGGIAFAGSPGKSCQVVVLGPRRAASLAKLRTSIARFTIPLAPDPANSGARGPGVQLETFKGELAPGATLYVQLIDVSTGKMPMAALQISAMGE